MSKPTAPTSTVDNATSRPANTGLYRVTVIGNDMFRCTCEIESDSPEAAMQKALAAYERLTIEQLRVEAVVVYWRQAR